jgi:hypothetical protein
VRLAERDRRVLLAGVSLILGALLLVRILPGAVRAAWALDLRVEQQRQLLSDIESDLQGGSALEDSASSVLNRFRRLAFHLLPGTSDAEAAAELANRIEVAAARAGGRMVEATPIADTTRVARLHRVSLRVALEGDLRGLVEILRALERDSVVITVNALRIVASDAPAPDDQPEALRAEVLIRGWYAAGSALVLPRRAAR